MTTAKQQLTEQLLGIYENQLKGKESLYKETLLYIKTEVEKQHPTAIVESLVLSLKNYSTDVVHFEAEAIINNYDYEVELDGNKIAEDLFVDLYKITNPEIIKEVFKEFYAEDFDWEYMDEYENWFNGFIDSTKKQVHLFLGGESDHEVLFDCMNNMTVINEFEEEVVVPFEIK